MVISLVFRPPLLSSSEQSLLRCHPAGIGRHTALNIPESVSEEARSLLEQVGVRTLLSALTNEFCCCWGSGMAKKTQIKFFNNKGTKRLWKKEFALTNTRQITQIIYFVKELAALKTLTLA